MIHKCRPLRRVAAVLLAAALMVPLAAAAELVVVVNAQSGVERLSRTQVINIFLGHDRQLPGGLKAVAVDLPASMPEKARFYRSLVNRDLSQIAAYWSRLVFAGATAPPMQANSLQDAVQFIATRRGAIGYVDRDAVDGRMKIVFSLP